MGNTKFMLNELSENTINKSTFIRKKVSAPNSKLNKYLSPKENQSTEDKQLRAIQKQNDFYKQYHNNFIIVNPDPKLVSSDFQTKFKIIENSFCRHNTPAVD